MEQTVYNPQKGRQETIDVEFTKQNTTWFDNCTNSDDIYMITDFENSLLITGFGYSYPVYIYDLSRAAIGNNQKKALEIKKHYE